MKYLIGAGAVLLLQAMAVLIPGEFYLHWAPQDHVIQFGGTVITMEGLDGGKTFTLDDLYQREKAKKNKGLNVR